MKIGSYLFSFAKARGNIAAVALTAVLMAANATVASAQNEATENNGTGKTILVGVDDLDCRCLFSCDNSLDILNGAQLSTQMKPTETRLCVCITSVPESF